MWYSYYESKMLTAEEKKGVMKNFSRETKDTGSPEVQISLMTERINHLEQHFKDHKKDHNSRRGLLIVIGGRRRLLNYLKVKNPTKYETVISKLGLRK